jgi:hypothetical protein
MKEGTYSIAMLSPITQNTLFSGDHRPILREYLAHLLHGVRV